MLLAFGEEVSKSRGDSQDASDDSADAGDDPAGVKRPAISAHGVIFSRLSGAEARNLDEDEDASDDKSDDGDEVQKPSELVESFDFEDGKKSANDEDEHRNDQKNESDDGAHCRIINGICRRFAIKLSRSGFSENALNTRKNKGITDGLSVINNGVGDGRAGHHKDEGDNRNYGCDKAGEL